ncbi:hypothetical protein GJ631_16045 [Natronomonas sp. CBA1123]|nr:hypothetical protein [Natronomonas sp. CBA1123]MUV88023.1 hypothetical protein [Natronomonas sp. CBA1123]
MTVYSVPKRILDIISPVPVFVFSSRLSLVIGEGITDFGSRVRVFRH